MFSTPFKKTRWPIPPTLFYLQTFQTSHVSKLNALLSLLHQTLSFDTWSIFTTMKHFLMSSMQFQLFQRSTHINQAMGRGHRQGRRKLRAETKVPSEVKRTQNWDLSNLTFSFPRWSAHKNQQETTTMLFHIIPREINLNLKLKHSLKIRATMTSPLASVRGLKTTVMLLLT